MSSDFPTGWTAILTNIAVVLGLIFVGLEFRNNTQTIEAERIDGYVSGVQEINLALALDADLSDFIFRSYSDPGSLSRPEIDRLETFLWSYHFHFLRLHHFHEAGLIPDEIWNVEKAGVGFAFSSEIGLNMVDVMLGSTMANPTWEIIKESALVARAFCADLANKCSARYQGPYTSSD